MTDMNASYVVGILSSSTLRMDQDNANHPIHPSDLNLQEQQQQQHRRCSSNIINNNNNTTTSFQITSVTRRTGEDLADDSCDDLDESHTDDLSSDVLDSSRAEGYHSEDDLSSPCCPPPQVVVGMVDRNMNLSLGVTPTFAALGPVAGGVTMMTSKSESPISAQVPVMNPLPNNWQRRFKVVKIMSSEPFARGRWVCMDFKDPPHDSGTDSPKLNGGGGTSTPPTIQITNCDEIGLENLAQVYEIPIGGNFVMNQQHMYGIILPPQSDYVHQTMTLVQEDRNCNHLLHHQSILVRPMYQSPPATTVLLDNGGAAEAVLNQINANVVADSAVPPGTPPLSRQRSRNNSHSGMLPPPPISLMDNHNSEHNESSQSAPEKLPSSEVGPEVDPSAGSAASTGGNTVAIDNKIEQAMDLVKSHLMFAVREEVEVLKEKITELLERISQLEHENDILRANASAETLKQLNSHKSGGKPIPPP